MDFAEELRTYVAASFPIIVVNTTEIGRVRYLIGQWVDHFNEELMENHGTRMDLIVWNRATGLEDYLTSKAIDMTEPFETMLNYLHNDLIIPQGNPCIILIENYHLHLYKEHPSFAINVELLRSMAQTGKTTHQHIILIGNAESIPAELKDISVVLDFKLPSKADFERYLDDSLSGTAGADIKLTKAEKEAIVSAGGGMTLNEFENAVCVSLTKNRLKRIDPADIFIEKANLVKKSGLLELLHAEENLEDIGGLNNLKENIRKIAKAFSHRKDAEKYRLPRPKGSLIVGVSGAGKTLTAKAIANHFKLPLYRCDLGRLFGGIIGETEHRTRELFKLMEALAPCVILIDEIEKAMAGTESSTYSDGGVSARLMGSFLYFMQENKYPIYFVATANSVSLPPEMLRAGRWDDLWFVDLPTIEEREEIFKIHLRKVRDNIKPFEGKLKTLATMSDKYTGAEIETAVHKAMFAAFYEDREFTIDDIDKALNEITPLSKIKADEIRALRAWAEQNAKIANRLPARKKAKTKGKGRGSLLV